MFFAEPRGDAGGEGFFEGVVALGDNIEGAAHAALREDGVVRAPGAGDADAVDAPVGAVLAFDEDLDHRDERAALGGVGSHIGNQTSFDPRNYGYKRLSDLVRSLPYVIVDTREMSGNKHDYVRLK